MTIKRRTLRRLKKLPPEVRADLLRVLTSPSNVRADVIRQFHERGDDGMVEVRTDLEADEPTPTPGDRRAPPEAIETVGAWVYPRCNMHLVYLDDSRDEKLAIAAGLVIPVDEWNSAFAAVRAWRRDLKASDGIYVYKELHATDFVAGRGRISSQPVGKYRRSQIFGEALDLVTKLPGAQLFNCIANNDEEDLAYERVLNRLNRTLQPDVWNSYAMLLWDEGKDAEHRKLTRRMRVINPIPSRYGGWPEGTVTKNIRMDRIIEDPVFKKSEHSHFIQLVDFCAYALLRAENPLASKSKYGIDKAFALLQPICFKAANKKDPNGIVRTKLRPSASGGAGKQGLPPPPRTESVLQP